MTSVSVASPATRRRPRATGRARALMLLGGILTAGWLALVPAPAVADPHPTPPRAVTESLAPGGKAFDDAVRLSVTNEKGDVDAAARKELEGTVTLGAPRLYFYYWAPTSSHNTAPTFTDADYSPVPGPMWLSVMLRSGTPYSMVGTDQDGNTLGVGGWLDEQLRLIDALPTDDVIMTDRFDDAYAISGDSTTITALTPKAVDLIGAGPVDAPTFRAAKARQAAAVAAALTGQDLPDDAVGGSSGTSPTAAPPVGAGLAVVGAALVVAGLLLLRLRRRAGGRHDRRAELAADPLRVGAPPDDVVTEGAHL